MESKDNAQTIINAILKVDPTLTGLTEEELRASSAIPQSEVSTALAYRSDDKQAIKEIFNTKYKQLEQIVKCLCEFSPNAINILKTRTVESNEKFEIAMLLLSHCEEVPVPFPSSWYALLSIASNTEGIDVQKFAEKFIEVLRNDKLSKEIDELDYNIGLAMASTRIIKMNRILGNFMNMHKEGKLSTELTKRLYEISKSSRGSHQWSSSSCDHCPNIATSINWLARNSNSMFYEWDTCVELAKVWAYFYNLKL